MVSNKNVVKVQRTRTVYEEAFIKEDELNMLKATAVELYELRLVEGAYPIDDREGYIQDILYDLIYEFVDDTHAFAAKDQTIKHIDIDML